MDRVPATEKGKKKKREQEMTTKKNDEGITNGNLPSRI